jgi:hypothetical protein
MATNRISRFSWSEAAVAPVAVAAPTGFVVCPSAIINSSGCSSPVDVAARGLPESVRGCPGNADGDALLSSSAVLELELTMPCAEFNVAVPTIRRDEAPSDWEAMEAIRRALSGLRYGQVVVIVQDGVVVQVDRTEHRRVRLNGRT